MSGKTPQKLHIGVLLRDGTEHLDFAGADLFAVMAKEYIKELDPTGRLDYLGIADLKISYVWEEEAGPGSASAAIQMSRTSANASIHIDRVLKANTPDEQEPLFDVLMIPGSNPTLPTSETILRFIRRHADPANSSHVLVICTGVYLAARAGILDGIPATGTRMFVGADLINKFPKVKWDDTKRWVAAPGGKIWTAGGVSNGLDMIAAYLRATVDPELAEFALALAEVGDRPQEYSTSKAESLRWFTASDLAR